MNLTMMGIAFGIAIGSALRKMLVPITPDGKTEAHIQEEAYIAGYYDGLDCKHGNNLAGFVYQPPRKEQSNVR